jgi:hypothetical protein
MWTFRYLSFLVLTASFLIATQTSVAAFQNNQPSALTGPSFPIPPRHGAPWHPPQTSLPATFLTSSIKLFEQGLADPRDCEYRQVEIAVSSIWGGVVMISKTHAWVLPQQRDVSHRFVIAWNGLVYPAHSIGDKANLKEDVLAAVKADEDARAKSANKFPAAGYRFRLAWQEGLTVSHASLLPLKACLLLRLGENLLAEQVWTTWISGMNREVNDDALHLQDPYIMLAFDWLWARFERAVCAHMRRDDRLAVNDARFLNSVQYDVADAVEKRSASWPRAYKEDSYRKRAYFAFLGPVSFLLSDQERRSKERRVREPVQTIAIKYETQAKLVAALILELDEASAYQHGQPGGVDISDDAVVQELIKQGGAAVEPLVIVFEQDKRLTRSVSFHRDFSRQRHIINVYEAAYRALALILKISSNEEVANWEDIRKGRLQIVATRLRTAWNKHRQGTSRPSN